jgi:hypothetical protein
MRTAVSLVMLMLMVPLLAGLSATAEMNDNGTTITVTDTETWNASTPIDKNINIVSGASMFIDAATTVNQDVTITVQQGATLTLNGDLSGEDFDAGLAVYNDTKLHLNFGDLSETGQVRITFDQVIPESAMFNLTIGEETRNAVGEEYVDIPAPLNGTLLTVEFDVYYFYETQVLSVQALHTGSSGSVTIDAENINHTDGSLKWNSAAFSLNVVGSLNINNATIAGADIMCAGTCNMNGVTATGSAPIHVQDGGSLTVTGSEIQGSRTDEDIVVHDTADIEYTETTGTGGLTDAWIRLLSQRTLHTNAGNITVHATGLGYYGSTIDNITNDEGHVGYALSEHARIVEWVDGSGDYHQENAEILLTLSSNWGDYAITVDAPRTPTASVAVPLPYINVKSIDLEDDKGYTNSGLSGDVVIENTGNAGATGMNFWCYVDGELQDTSQLVVSLDAGETKTVYVTWYTNSPGLKSLECTPLVPNIMKSITSNITNTEGSTSQLISWNLAEETEDQPLMIFGLLILVILAGGYVVANQASKAAMRKPDQPEEFEEEQKTYLEDEQIEDETQESEDDDGSEVEGLVWDAEN